MSGLLVRSHMTAGQDGSRDVSSKQGGGIDCRWVPRSVSRLGSIDHTICVVSSKLRPQHEAMVARALNSYALAIAAASRGVAHDCPSRATGLAVSRAGL
jgi:hypothetical protein